MTGFVLSLSCMSMASNADESCEVKLGRCIPVCTIMDDAFVALSYAAKTNLSPTNGASSETILFNRSIGPFNNASVKNFTPHVPCLNHNFFAGGQMELIISTSIVYRTTFDVCKTELLNVKKMFERYKIEFDVIEDKGTEEYGFKTANPTWGGWNVFISVRRMNGAAFEYTMMLRRDKPKKITSEDVQVDVDI